jgi:uncharacterized membrane protein
MLVKFFSKRSAIQSLTLQQWMLLSCAFSCLLLFIRVVTTSTPTYLFLAWNLFLGFIPFAISRWLATDIGVVQSKLKLILAAGAWLLFIPNSFYILTDLFHLEQFDNAPKWFDLLLLFSFAWNGLMLGVVSVRRIEMLIVAKCGERLSLLFVVLVMWMNAFGIYIGRYLRFNSWDIFLQPFSLSRQMLEIIIHPIQNGMEWGMITIYAVFMTLLYITARKMGEDLSSPKLPLN